MVLSDEWLDEQGLSCRLFH